MSNYPYAGTSISRFIDPTYLQSFEGKFAYITFLTNPSTRFYAFIHKVIVTTPTTGVASIINLEARPYRLEAVGSEFIASVSES